MLLNQKYEIFPSEEQKTILDRWLQYCRQTYNSAQMDKERKYEEIANQIKDFLHKLSYNLTKDYSVIAVENLNIRNMVRSRKLSKSISDAVWGMF